MSEAKIPLVDLGLQHRRIAAEVAVGFNRVLANTSFILGPEVEEFEQAYARYCQVAHCVGVGNGTDAVELALRACRIGAGDEVIIPANTFIATAEAVARTGATITLVDCGDDYLIDVSQIAEKISERTKAIVPVHLYGQMASMSAVRSAVGENVVIIEDAAQSQGARQDGRRSGSIGLVSATSFYPGKNLGAYGDAGAVTTDDIQLAQRLRSLRNHGGVRKYEHLEIGMNSRMDGLQAVVLSAKLALLDSWNSERLAIAGRYATLLSDVEQLTLPTVAAGNEHVWHLYVVRVPHRDEVVSRLNQAGIGAGIHYPAPIHRLPAFAECSFGDYPRADRFAGEILSLPLFPGMTDAQQDRVSHELRAALR